nr:hypothetical protein [Crocosphaera watsonii]
MANALKVTGLKTKKEVI